MGMIIFIVVLLFIIIYIYCRQSVVEQGEEFEVKERQLGIISTTFLIHLNGHPYLQANDIITFQIRQNKTIYFENKNLNTKKQSQTKGFIGNEIPISQLTRHEVKTETEIRRDVTLTRLITLGIFAFGVKKKTEESTQYLILTYLDNGVEVTCLFKQVRDGQELGEIISTLNRMKVESTDINTQQTRTL